MAVKVSLELRLVGLVVDPLTVAVLGSGLLLVVTSEAPAAASRTILVISSCPALVI